MTAEAATRQSGSSGHETGGSGMALVVEVGGTTTRAGRFDLRASALVERTSCPSPNNLSGPGDPDSLGGELVAAIDMLAHEVIDGETPEVVAVAYPGPIDGAGRVLAAPTLLGTGFSGAFDLRGALAERWPTSRVLLLNDLTAAGYRYLGRTEEPFCILTVGSGIGHKVFVDGRPLLGPGFRGGEIGHLRVDRSQDAIRCDCGGVGHLGGIASGRGTTSWVRREAEQDPHGFASSLLGPRGTEGIDSYGLAAAFEADDPWVRAAVRGAVSHLGLALAAIHLAVGVERFIVTGGFAIALGEPYRKLLVDASATACWNLGQDWDRMISLGCADDNTGMIGLGVAASRAC